MSAVQSAPRVTVDSLLSDLHALLEARANLELLDLLGQHLGELVVNVIATVVSGCHFGECVHTEHRFGLL